MGPSVRADVRPCRLLGTLLRVAGSGMGRGTSAQVVDNDDIVRAVASEARQRAGTWFPEFEGRQVQAQPLGREPRPGCVLYRVGITDDRRTRIVVVKVRHSLPELRRLDRLEDRRPVLTPERTLPDLQTARREYEGLRLVEELTRRFTRPRMPEWG